MERIIPKVITFFTPILEFNFKPIEKKRKAIKKLIKKKRATSLKVNPRVRRYIGTKIVINEPAKAFIAVER